MQYILSLDQGTTSSRAVLFDENGALAAMAQYPLTQHYPQPGWVEHDAAEILSTQLRAAADAISVLREKTGGSVDIAAVGVTNQRETAILWDAATGKPLCPAIVWQCRRTAPMIEELVREGCTETVRGKTGLVMDAYFSGTKIKWMLDELYGGGRVPATVRFGNVDSWLIWNLTGGACGKYDAAAHVTDYSNASRTMLFDIHKLRFDGDLCEMLGVPEFILPRAFSGCEIIGRVASGIPGLEALAGVPVAGSAGDQAAALFGQCATVPGMAKNTYGTGCFTLMNTGGECVASSHGLVTSVAWCVGGKVTYALEGSAFNAGAAIQWLRDGLGLIKTARECDELAEKVDSNGGVYLVPAFTGLGAPYWDMHARGVICGLTRGATRAHIARATLESIAYQVTDLVETMQLDADAKITELRVDGGASVSDIMMQFQADMLGLPVNRPASVESTAAGAAFLAGIACGLWRADSPDRIRRTERVFTPAMTAGTRYDLYDGWKNAVAKARLS